MFLYKLLILNVKKNNLRRKNILLNRKKKIIPEKKQQKNSWTLRTSLFAKLNMIYNTPKIRFKK